MKIIKPDDETGSHMDHPREGRPRFISAAQGEFIQNNSLSNQMFTAHQFKPQINATHFYINIL